MPQAAREGAASPTRNTEGERPRSSATPEAAREGAASPTRNRVAIASDHGGFTLKLHLIQALAEAKIDYEDFGPSSPAMVDYPPYAKVVAEAVAGKKATLGVLCCGSGIGMSIAANKVKGVRAVLCHTELEARLSRQHNDCNVLCLGERLIGAALARAILEVFLNTQFEGGRHAVRLSQIE